MSESETATRTRTAEETEAVGERLAATLSRSDVIYLVGDLGAGKTTLARGLARGLGAETREVASPTFALLNEYAAASPGPAQRGIVLRHLDLYRLADDPRDLAILGLPDAVADAPVCVEWPGEAIRRLLPPTVEITIVPEPRELRHIRVRRIRG
ncbi:MAG TPA: tRNA (adenosine(37)-N6)-threonylcarbamoyltransferase complex ATPase subunit type 1 TsaE [Thermoanaerobaculia bacterium]|jgi:tRNA threonylcarbamoyl adenosine modification protein YjeE